VIFMMYLLYRKICNPRYSYVSWNCHHEQQSLRSHAMYK
jgi:hypothetical protein